MSLKVEFQSKSPHRTLFLEIEYPVDHYPTELVEELGAIGWVEDEGLFDLPPLFGFKKMYVQKPGTDLFNSWKPKEKKQFMAEALDVLQANGFPDMHHRKLTLADLM